MGLRVVHSDRSELLLEALAERVARRTDPFTPFVIVVPSRLVSRHVELFLARRLGIAAALTMKRLPALLEERIEAVSGRTLLTSSRLEARLLDVLLRPERLAGAELAAVRSYLGASNVGGEGPRGLFERRASELAARLARLISAYAHDRPELVLAWLRGEPARDEAAGSAVSIELDRWQRALLTAALQTANGRESVVSIAEGPALLADAPAGPPIAIFGHSFFSRAELGALVGIGARSDVLVLTPNPCAEFWEDATRRAGREEGAEESTLLAAWGSAAREHVAAIDAASGFAGERTFAEDDESTLLGRTQASIRGRRPIVRGGGTPAGASTKDDASIEIVAAPSLRREVESLAEEIWAVVHAAAGTATPIRFPDIAIWLTARDRELYLPHIETVFAEAHHLPWSAIDLSLASRSRAVEALLRLVALLASGPTRTTLLDVVLHPLVLARLGASADPSAIAQKLDRLGFFFGGEQADVPAAYALDARSIHLDQAIERLALGAAMLGERSGDGRFFERSKAGEEAGRYLPEEIDPESEPDLALVALLRSLAADVRFARSAELPLETWSTFFVAMADAYLSPDEAEGAELRRALFALRELGRTGPSVAAGAEATSEREHEPGAISLSEDEPVAISLSTACDLAARALESLPAVGGAGGHGVVVGTLAPMRALSFRVVLVLGLGEGRFPTRERDTGLDLRTGHRRPGEVSVEDRDRHALLEALVSARDRLVLSFVARDEQTGDPIAPSHALTELIEATSGEVPIRRPLLRRHDAVVAVSGASAASTEALVRAAAIPAAGAEARARMLGGRERGRFSESATPLHELATTLPAADVARVLLAMPEVPEAPIAERATLRVSLADLRRFLDCPMQGAARRSLAMDRDPGVRFAESEPFETDERVHEALVRALVVGGISTGGAADGRAIESDIEELATTLAAHGRFPLGAFGGRAREAARADAAQVSGQLARMRPGAHTVSACRFGAAREHERDATRALDAVVLGRVPDGGEGRLVELIGTTAPLLDGKEPLRFDLGRPRAGERRMVHDLRLALHSFLDHCALALGPGTADGAPERAPRRAPIVGRRRGVEVVLAPVNRDLARRWLFDLAREVALEPHAYFLPIEAVLRIAHVFKHGSGRLEDQLESSIELVRTKWEGGRSRFGPLRDAVHFPPPERAARLAGKRFAIFFTHLSQPTPEPPRVKRGRA